MFLKRSLSGSSITKCNIFRKFKLGQYNTVYYCTKHIEGEGRIVIGDVTKDVKTPKNPELIPQNYIKLDKNGALKFSQSTLHNLRWMFQKDNLKQDMFLLGYPGPSRRNLAMQFLQLTQRELEYLSLSRDTTESDLKQRREIKDKEAIYFDQCAVRAAQNGRILILDGVEHAERNVLPILNNLLENREMHLENGKFLMAPERYDKLLKEYSKSELDKWGLIRVSEDFRIIALGLPTQKYKGTPLDPPLRSRFQSRNITHLSFEEILKDLKEIAPNANEYDLKKILSFGLAIHASEPTANVPDFPIDNLHLIAKIMNNNSDISVHEAICSLYPYRFALSKENLGRVKTLFEQFEIDSKTNKPISTLKVGEKIAEDNSITINIDGNEIKILGGKNELSNEIKKGFVDLDHQRNILGSMYRMYSAGDFCLIGPKGVGKSTLVNQILRQIGQSIEPMVLYEDMTSRDFIQQRITTVKGDTVWRDSPLVRAAVNGSVAVLDGIDRLHKSTASILQRLVHDRELQLCDGTILLRKDRYDALLSKGFSKEDLILKGIFPMHPAFRIIALAEPPTLNLASKTNNWLTSEILSLFLFQDVRPLSKSEEVQIIEELYGNVHSDMHKVIELSHILRDSNNSAHENLADTLSTRQLLKIAHRMSVFPSNGNEENSMNSLYEILQNVFLAKFMPALPRAALENAMAKAGIEKPRRNKKITKKIEVKDNILRIGSTEMKLMKTEFESKVPSTLFYDIPHHVELLERLLQDFIIGEHILLVGNQGVGKNKLVDKLLQLMNKPREYLQLHRDTTVHSLTVQSTLRDGQVVFDDSPLVKAVKEGHVLVIDEADKAPVNVTCILRTLVENGEMFLSDGRKIVPKGSTQFNKAGIIETHPDFRVIVLANRPGFPFLGNDFFASLGDVFSCHAVDNPSPESEIYLLQQYGPSVPRETLSTLVNAFGELRQMADEGLLNYPYSTREVVNIVKHIEKYPNDSMSELVGNVLDFDRYSPETLDQVTDVLLKHGLNIGAYAKNELSVLRRKKEIQLTVERKSGLDVSSPKHGKIDPNNEPHVGGNTWAGGTGGRDTAGLGGKGGPYRLDAGHQVHQLSDAEKDDIPEEVKKAAREMNRKAFAEKLKEIKMSEHDYKIYAQFSAPNRKQVQQIKAVLNALQSKNKERQWQKYQTSGELDDTRLIEGITGEKNIYKKRGEASPWTDQVNEKPNRLKLVVDVSGSMYRFNGYDGRLEREMEAVIMVMEAFEGYEKKIVYDIVGHSGETAGEPFVVSGKPPLTDKERLHVIKMMHAHAQFCWSGDNTLKATTFAIEELAKEDNDNSIVIVLSDANLSRYGIPPTELAKALMEGEPKIQSFVIFIGSLGDQADTINSEMPPGRSYVCMDLMQLPQILKQIFTTSLMVS
ncbi:von Willebrand factor A domain-containing protein 8 [Condylostylus longicornis]|uniref:von Willebrand factor A domain-containing protein 8 n=1 Tax=Condylostylus longicornis TaxID=2530218 RepID=UPI00244E131A|nr:von Willebrand factor A domain-containing protein 8 [Condylostylus longicornis]